MKSRLPAPDRQTLLVLLAGLLAFALFSGFSALSPTRLSWVMINFDTPTHYLGWQFFRQTPWDQWPIGMNPLYGFDAPASVVLSDSIPLMALLFKPISGLLPADFQYFGLWILACFLLQAWFASKLLRRFSSSHLFCFAGSLFFVTATVFLLRIYLHPALAGQWLLLAGLYLCISPRFRGKAWLLLLVTAALVHAYLLLMAAALWGADLLQRAWRREVSARHLGWNAVAVAALVPAVMWAAGYFLPISVVGVASTLDANLLLGFWNGQNPYGGSWSALVPTFSLAPGTGEGFGYMGVGFMLLVVCALIPWRRTPASSTPVPASTWWTLSLVCTVMFFFALGDKVYAGDRLLFSYDLPAWHGRLRGILRGAGRFVWPLWYLTMLAALYRVATRLPPRRAGWLVAALMLVQCADLSKPAMDYRRNYQLRAEWHPELTSPAWQSMAQKYQRVVFMMGGEWATPNALSVSREYLQVANFAAKHGMGVNVAYLARVDDSKWNAQLQRRQLALRTAQFEPGTLYVLKDEGLLRDAGCLVPAQVWAGRIDGIELIVPGGESILALRALPETACAPR